MWTNLSSDKDVNYGSKPELMYVTDLLHISTYSLGTICFQEPVSKDTKDTKHMLK